MGTAPPSPPPLSTQLHEHRAVLLEDLFELSNNSDASIHRSVRVMNFYFSGDETNLQNRELQSAKSMG